ncbi:hypothetical protein J1605_014812 [Eschrichtius robustus]|uniref:Uncharacterized protein n=1 Tax=Eschrichtius robustus TaxID=9764 RepID=A0AB34GD89_ESCRO|nr:hypothetical protein J1605_014812 [Eschrichtius robustus]
MSGNNLDANDEFDEQLRMMIHMDFEDDRSCRTRSEKTFK